MDIALSPAGLALHAVAVALAHHHIPAKLCVLVSSWQKTGKKT